MNIPFTKAHGARNDFLLTRRDQLPALLDASAAAIAICDRHTGAGADGWLLVSRVESADGAIELWNSDGRRAAPPRF
jgi:diaminopimelate epimerase